MIRTVCLILLLAGPALAQTTTFRDPAGNPIGHLQQQGDRTIVRDTKGDQHGYSVRRGSVIEHRDVNGNLLYTETTR